MNEFSRPSQSHLIRLTDACGSTEPADRRGSRRIGDQAHA